MLSCNRPAIAIALAVLSLTLGGCVTRQAHTPDPHAAARAAEVERERSILRETALKEGKPANIVDKIVETFLNSTLNWCLECRTCLY